MAAGVMVSRSNRGLQWPAGMVVAAQEPLSQHTCFGIGGLAEYFVEVRDLETFLAVLNFCRIQGIPRLILGEGSNVLIGDGGVPGLTIHNAYENVEDLEGGRVRAGSGVLMGRLARWCADHGLAGVEFGVGIPGTVGGSVFGNAGCFGAEIRDVLESALVWLPGGVEQLANERLDFAYRTSALQSMSGKPVVLEATFRLHADSPQAIQERMTKLSARRRATQPSGRSAGSVFRNPPGDHAGRLLDQAGMKGRQRGAAEFSRKHANFIVNTGGATAADVAWLIREAREAVRSLSGVQLELEIRLIGQGFGEEA